MVVERECGLDWAFLGMKSFESTEIYLDCSILERSIGWEFSFDGKLNYLDY